MPISVECPNCMKIFQVATGKVGDAVKCPECSTRFYVPPQTVTATPPAPERTNTRKPSTAVEPPKPVEASASANPRPAQPPPPGPAASNALDRRWLLAGGATVLLFGIVVFGAAGIGIWWALTAREQERPVQELADDGQVLPEIPMLVQKEPEQPKEPPPPDPRIEKVKPNVAKGVAYMMKNVPSIASQRAGYAGLNGLAFLECGVSPDDPAIAKMAETIRAAAPGMNLTYDLSASLFFLNRWNESRPLNEKDRTMARTLALRIIAGQSTTGIWGYGGSVMTPEQEAKLLASLQQETYKPHGPGSAPDISNTQFALLAVWGARKHGVPVHLPLMAAAAYFHANQGPDGSWTYGLAYPGHSRKATSRCAGLISLAIEAALLDHKEFARIRRPPDGAKKRADLDKAFAFLVMTIGRKKGDPGVVDGHGGQLFGADAAGDLYFLWALERVGVIYSKELIGGKDWYKWGSEIIAQNQKDDGSWDERNGLGGPLADSCFAILFLKRANVARDPTEMIRSRRAN